MKMHRSLNLFALLLLPLGFALRAQENPPAPPAPPEERKAEAAKPDQPPAGGEAKAGEADKPAAQTKPDEAEAAQKDEQATAPEDRAVESTEPAKGETAQPAEKFQKLKDLKKLRKLDQLGSIKVDARHSPRGDRVHIMDDVVVSAGEIIRGDAVAVMGDLKVDGEVMHDAVAVMGDNTINGTVHHDVVAVMGDLTLGPKARVEGNAVCVGGEIRRDPGAVVGGEVRAQGIGFHGIDFERLTNVWDKTLKVGRPLAIGAHLGWLWIITGFSVAIYALLALLFPQSIRRCGDKLMQEPGLTILAAVLSLLALPVLFILLCITIIGIPVALFLLPLAVILAAFFGKASIYALVGRRLTGDRWHLALATILGTFVFVLLFLVPVVGLLLSLSVAFLGFGAVVLVLFTPKPKPAVVPVASGPGAATLGASPFVQPQPPSMPLVSPGFGASTASELPPSSPVVPPSGAGEGIVPPVPPVGAPPVLSPVAPAMPSQRPAPQFSVATLPRAGFWIRVAAAFLDLMIIFIPAGILELFRFGPGLPFLLLAAYHVAMWKHKGTTVGGVICHLRLVRLDDRPIDWGVALVRGTTAFLSFVLVGLGFIWVAFDDEKQSWHDKVAGTTIVRVPKGTPLL
jgi:uncharacterized RDD family membrane protein YckC